MLHNPLVRLALVFVVVMALIVMYAAGREAAKPHVDTIGYRYINGVADCPTSPEFGELVAPVANVWETPDMLRKIGELRHGTRIAVLRGASARGFYRIDFNGREGWVQSVLIVNYDPLAEPVRPNNDDCI